MQSVRELMITRHVAIQRTARVVQLEGMFDVPPSERSARQWNVTLPLDERSWNVGLIVGASGSGKTTILRECFGDAVISSFDDWPHDKSLLDAFPKTIETKDIALMFNAVGFSSPPSWLKPFRVLSNGEQFRATLARILLEYRDLTCVDEFTSVVDRTVAQIGSCAVAKTVRARNQQFIAASCHYDIIDWMQPDWLYDAGSNLFSWRSLQRRPNVELRIAKVQRTMWQLFREHHYLNHDLNPVAQCFAAFYRDEPVAFEAVLPFPHPRSPGWRAHRIVTLPDYQGIGIGARLSDTIASMFVTLKKRFRLRTSAPGLRAYCRKSKHWSCTAAFKLSSPANNASAMRCFGVIDRLAETFEYVGQRMNVDDAGRLWNSSLTN